MYYGEIKKCDIANGEGVRVSLFVSGCTHHCPGCFNADTWNFKYGSEYTDQTEKEILEALSPSYINGLTLLGGEPFEPENQKTLVGLLRKVRESYPEKNIWCYTGYLYDEQLLNDSRARCEYTDEMLSMLDVLVDGEFVMSLSDGMGSGSRACKESEMVIELIEKFLEAGFSKETAIRMMNSAMVMKGADDLYSTVDLCKINLYTGMAKLYKIGAAATFIKRGAEVECITSQSLPVGAQVQMDISVQETKLTGGDFVVMVTDGVLEYLHVKKPEDTMQEIIESIQTNNPGILAKKIMERVMLFTGGKAKDDMTVLAACIWEK